MPSLKLQDTVSKEMMRYSQYKIKEAELLRGPKGLTDFKDSKASFIALILKADLSTERQRGSVITTGHYK